jgi:hypothetical protein
MRKAWILAVAAVVLVGAGPKEKPAAPPPGPAPSPGEKQVWMDLRVWQGDPFGSRQAGTLKLLADPKLMTLDGAGAAVNCGGQQAVEADPGRVEFVPIGHIVKVLPRVQQDGRIRLRVTAEVSSVVEQSDDRLQVNTQSSWTVHTVRTGEWVRMRFAQSKDGHPVWAEVRVAEVK